MTFIVGAVKMTAKRPANVALTQYLNSDTRLALSKARDRTNQDYVFFIRTNSNIH